MDKVTSFERAKLAQLASLIRSYCGLGVSLAKLYAHRSELLEIIRRQGLANLDQLCQRLDMVRFRQGNVLEMDRWPDFREFDVVFCRNVLIYFDPAS